MQLEQEYIENIKRNYELGFGKVGNVGSCALVTVVLGKRLFVANLGDSKGVLFSKKENGLLTTDLNDQLNANDPKE